ncbi:5-amino-6-(5-phospho-D-ribitylamino)uracil phosphatase YigB [Vibrio salinus]|uniref:5-amino-6-(5-phospho-D-ribitylamino)uracil phosphatase YigB n=1 Tax=Vibrio salinus TaxID=2899784 RepID=UPI001E49A247|nr:5-amino-6-(5-phospho-D-ribitylamino)uracil phosphatase YigB [Vibrio salinus]MCE0493550.1 5-amino-6-(5-phospho-D-ribitylamino)uracil phosphatase YigB [Vibrio salinus]
MHFFRRLPEIQAMSFDLDDTLYKNQAVIDNMEVKFREWLVANHPVSGLKDRDWWLELKRAVLIDHPDIVHDVTLWRHTQIKCGLIKLGYNDTEANQAADVAMQEVLRLRNLISVPESTHRVLRLLSKKIPLVAISNGNANPESIGLSQYFQLELRAGPDGRAKPYPDMFEVAIAHLGVCPESVLHVGDHGRTDVLGAKNHGLSACWFNDRVYTARTFEKLTILPDIEIRHLDELLELIH